VVFVSTAFLITMVTIVVTNGLLEPLHINAKLPRPLGNARLKGHWWITGIVLAEPNENLEAPNAARRSGLWRRGYFDI